MKTLTITLALAAAGVAAMIYGGKDDAPGLVLVGVVVILGAIAIGGRAIYRRR